MSMPAPGRISNPDSSHDRGSAGQRAATSHPHRKHDWSVQRVPPEGRGLLGREYAESVAPGQAGLICLCAAGAGRDFGEAGRGGEPWSRQSVHRGERIAHLVTGSSMQLRRRQTRKVGSDHPVRSSPGPVLSTSGTGTPAACEPTRRKVSTRSLRRRPLEDHPPVALQGGLPDAAKNPPHPSQRRWRPRL